MCVISFVLIPPAGLEAVDKLLYSCDFYSYRFTS